MIHEYRLLIKYQLLSSENVTDFQLVKPLAHESTLSSHPNFSTHLTYFLELKLKPTIKWEIRVLYPSFRLILTLWHSGPIVGLDFMMALALWWPCILWMASPYLVNVSAKSETLNVFGEILASLLSFSHSL